MCVVCLAALAGCEQKMANQPRYDPLEASRFFPDGQSARHPPTGTVARGHSPEDRHFRTGRTAGASDDLPPSLDRPGDYVTEFPAPVTEQAMRRGRERYLINCVPCHGHSGNGTGTVVAAGYPRAASLHEDRLRRAPIGYLFDVVTRGHGLMPSYAGQVSAADRWAVLAYVRALQFSRHAPLSELPPDIRARFEAGKP
jgi:mono/diheme cytochrome c family protein